MFYRPGGNTLLYANIPSSPPTDAELDLAAVLTPDHFLEAVEPDPQTEGGQDPDRNWIQVKATLLLAGERIGWVESAKVDPSEPPKPEPLDPWSFVKNCTLAARVINAGQASSGHGINRDFMVAYALMQTGTTTGAIPQNLVLAENGAPLERIGPFALLQAEWDAFVNGPGNTAGYVPSDIRNPTFQCYGFARLTFEATRAISQKFTINDLTRGSGPFVPSTTELFLYLAMGEPVALAFIQNTAAGQAAQPARSLVAGQPNEQALVTRYASFFGKDNEPLTIADFHKRLSQALDVALKRSFSLVREHTPEDIIYFVSGTLPWLVKAREEMVKGVKQTGTPPNQEILKYFSATALSPTTEIAWCGAFVAWCLMNCGSELVSKSLDKANAALAASWKTWGDVEVSIGTHEAAAVAPGTIVVLRPQTDDSSGHVGFFVSQTATHVTLLGGNQGKSVKESNYRRDEVVAMRMLKGMDFVPGASSGPGTVDPNFASGLLGPFTAADWDTYTNVLGRRESNNNYAAVNQIGFCGRWQFGAGALIDGGYLRPGAVTRRLKESHWWTGKNGVTSRDEWLANVNGCQDQEMIAYTRRNYRSLLNIKTTRPFTEGAPKAQLAGLLATSHLLGTGGTRKMVLGLNPADANGTTARKYFRMLSEAFGGGPTPPGN